MTLKARKCNGCKALPSGLKEGKCSMDRSFVTCNDNIIPLAPCCPDKSITVEAYNYKLSLLNQANKKMLVESALDLQFIVYTSTIDVY